MTNNTQVPIFIYSLYHHVATMAEAVQKGVISAGGNPDYTVITPDQLKDYDALLFGVPTRFGNYPAQWKAFWDCTGGLWTSGALYGKPAGIFETTAVNVLSCLVHHGIVYVPLGYAKAFPDITKLQEVHGSFPHGAGCFAGADGSRKPSALELEIAKIQGKSFWETVQKFLHR
ncbi:flavo protein WrbA [Metschnikowia bicuspidata]|uniref:Flavo protein WrbA n=1 Tax=Metschnikowia bicuspidata TaxID=27322 RepID=A0A4P9ZB55_9ASCO|nr:flavo protein WrbA [Metschnikowia bicuspidata]